MKFSSIAFPAISFIAFGATTPASAQMQDAFLASDHGTIYHLDGETLIATEVGQMEDARNTNDIVYLGNGRIAANILFAAVSYDLTTNTQTTLFTAQDVQSEPSGISLMSGLALQSNGDLYFTSVLHGPSGLHYAGATYNPISEDINLVEGSPNNHLYFDHHELSPGRMLGAISGSSVVNVFDPLTGIAETSYNLGAEVRSFVQFGDALFFLSSDNRLFTFDHSTGTAEFYGDIQGTDAILFGITIPAPSSAIGIGLVAMMYTRRRR
jgi:hypothetical protein